MLPVLPHFQNVQYDELTMSRVHAKYSISDASEFEIRFPEMGQDLKLISIIIENWRNAELRSTQLENVTLEFSSVDNIKYMAVVKDGIPILRIPYTDVALTSVISSIQVKISYS